ncbi:MAG TPA: YdeI/OmpD-associated family protein, partial [Chitinophagaceae bacterium]|nr:YdeI/OmpD-associated family protein [Chitinophagaceae bacterium]
AEKLKIKKGDVVLTMHAPADFRSKLAPLPEGVTITNKASTCQQVHWFVKDTTQLKKEVAKVMALINEAVICWIYYPKGSAGIKTDLSRDKGWEPLHAYDDTLTWISLISFDSTWSAFGCRLKKERDKARSTATKENPLLAYIDAASKTVKLPEDLAAALKKLPASAAFFDSLSYTNRKEYVEWIVTARREATRAERISGTLERLAKRWKNPRNL